MEKERKITAPEGCEIEKVELIDGVAVITFREKERKLPKSWEEFCENNPKKEGESYIGDDGTVFTFRGNGDRFADIDKFLLPNRETAEAVLAFCQLIQLRECYNQGWKPDWYGNNEYKYVIEFDDDEMSQDAYIHIPTSPLFFKTEYLCNQFFMNFRDLIEKLKPLYGIKEGGEE